MAKKRAKRSERETFWLQCTRSARHPSKVVAEEDEDEDYEAKGSDEEYDASLRASVEEIKFMQTLHSNTLANIQATLKLQEFMMEWIYERLFLEEDTSGGGGEKGGSTL